MVVTTCVIYSGQTPAQIFVSSPENLWHRFHWLPRAMSLIFRQYLLLYFIAAQGNIYYIPLLPSDISLVAWAYVYFISLLPSDISLVAWGRYLFYFIAAWGDVYFLINFLKGKFLSDDGSFLDLRPIWILLRTYFLIEINAKYSQKADNKNCQSPNLGCIINGCWLLLFLYKFTQCYISTELYLNIISIWGHNMT